MCRGYKIKEYYYGKYGVDLQHKLIFTPLNFILGRIEYEWYEDLNKWDWKYGDV